ncbi:MAG TPA: pitrilysin family protein, partial [Planctomycetota bacterium]|nr:pitrilysin family protein [Planctomycetota bacterium]
MSQSTSGVPAPGSLIIARERFVLPGGGILLVSRRPKAPVTAIRIHMRGGISLDPPGREGMAEWVGGLLDQGTTDRDEAGIADFIEPFGGSVSGDASGLRGSMAGDHWQRLLQIMMEMAARPTFPDAAVAVQFERLATHLRVQEEDPRVQGGRVFRRLVYGQHRLALPSGGTLASLEQVTAADLRAHHAAHWGSSRAILAVCGDVDPGEVHAQVLEHLKDWNVGSPLPKQEHRFPVSETRAEAFQKGREQVHVYFGHLGVRRSVADYPSLVVMDHVLGSGPGFVNRLSKKLRDEQGLAYSVYGDIHSSAGLLPGTFTAYIGTAPDKVEQAVRGIREEVRAICQDQVEPEELAMAKDYVTGSMVLGYERASRRAASLVAQEVHGFPEDHLET